MATNAKTPPILDYTNKDYASLVAAMLELARERLPEWTDHSPNDPGVMLVELFAAMGDMLFYHQDRIAGESFLATARERRSVMHHLRLIGYELRPPTSASTQLTLLFPDVTGEVTISRRQEFQTTKETTGTPVRFRHIRLAFKIDLDKLPRRILDGSALIDVPPDTKAPIYRVYRGLQVVQVDAEIDGEIVGSSDGSPGQRWKLQRSPLLDGTLRLTVEGDGEPEWTRVASLLYSQAGDRHFAVRRDELGGAWIEFGDGAHGKVPRRGRNNIKASYLVGGGARGNVPPRAITKAVVEIKPLKLVFNEVAASGGADAESIEEAVIRGPQQNRSMGRAVTKDDYEAHARSFGVAKVRAYAPAWSRINLVVAPAGGGLPSDTLKRDLREYFDAKRMITAQVEILDPKYIGVLLGVAVTAAPRHFNSQVGRKVDETLRALWSFDSVNFGDTLYLSKIYEAIEAIEGVAAVVVTTFWRSDVPYDQSQPALARDGTLRFGFDEIPYIEDVSLTVKGGLPDD